MVCLYVFGWVPKISTTDLVLILRGHCSARGTKQASLPFQPWNEEDLPMGSFQPLPLKLPFLSYGYLREALCLFSTDWEEERYQIAAGSLILLLDTMIGRSFYCKSCTLLSVAQIFAEVFSRVC